MIRQMFRSLLGWARFYSTISTRCHIHSMEGDIYLLEIEANGLSRFIEDKVSGKPKRFNSLAQAKRHAKRKGLDEIELVMQSPYDQMIGLATG